MFTSAKRVRRSTSRHVTKKKILDQVNVKSESVKISKEFCCGAISRAESTHRVR